MRHPALLVTLAGIAAAPSVAQPLIPAGSLTERTIPLAERGPTPGAPRQYGPPAGSIITMRDELENFPVEVSLGGTGVSAAPTSFTGPDGFEWGLNNLRGQASVNFVQVVDLAGSPIGGNGTRAVRVRTGNAQAPGSFFLGAHIRSQNPVEALPGANIRGSAELYISTIDEQFTFETAAAFMGYITSRALWGGTCIEDQPGDCTDNGLPVGPILNVLILGPNLGFGPGGLFVPAQYCRTAWQTIIPGCTPPPGFAIGDPVTPPIGAWSRWAVEISADNFVNYLLDRLDGNGETHIHRGVIITLRTIDRVGVNTAFESQDAFLLMDNVETSGPLLFTPKPPPLDCPYLDDLEWLRPGQLLSQSSRWFAALSSAATVIERSPGDQAIRQVNNVSSDNKHRVEITSALPNSYALPGQPWTFCVDVATTGQTVRAIALGSEAMNFLEGGVTARVFLGRADLTVPGSPTFDPTVFVQVDPWYDPIDNPFAVNPYDNAPTPGVEIVSTGYQWAADDTMRTLCVTVENDRSMTISVDGVEIYSGVAFANAAQVVQFESENNSFGWNSRMVIDNLSYACLPLPEVTLPALASPFFDDFAWGVENIPRVATSTTRRAARSPPPGSRAPTASSWTAGGVAMTNVFRDTVQVVPPIPGGSEAFQYSQFRTLTPSLPGGPGAGWTVAAEFESSEWGLTSRGWSPAQARPGGGFVLVGSLWHAAPNDTFYLFGRREDATQPGAQQFVVIQGPTRAALGLVAGEPYSARVRYVPDADRLDWFVNDQPVGSTFPLLDTSPLDQTTFTARNLDAFFVWSGDDETAAD